MNGKQEKRRHHGKSNPDVIMPAPIPVLELPKGYAVVFESLNGRIAKERIKAVLSANKAMVLMYWDFGMVILQRQKEEGWGPGNQILVRTKGVELGFGQRHVSAPYRYARASACWRKCK